MTRVEKSPNMMSTMGRMPVIAAPTAMPVKPASDIGVSRTRSVPNSSTKPVRTLNTVPASAISSPQMKTRESRRISSAIASRTASANVSSRVSGINVLVRLVWSRIGSSDRKLHRLLHFRLHFRLNPIEAIAIGKILGDHPIAQQFERVTLSLPHLLFLLRAIVLTIDVADMVSHKPVSIAQQKRRAGAGTGPVDDRLRCLVNRAHVLSIHTDSMQTKSGSAHQHIACGCFRIVCVFVVEVVFAHVDDGEFPKRRHVHHFVQQALSQRAVAEETHRNLTGLQTFCGKGRARRDP